MRNTWKRWVPLAALLIGGLLINAQAARAQSSRIEREPPRRPPETAIAPEPGPAGVPEPGLRFLSSEMTFNGKVVKNAPFSAEILTESEQTLGNGARMTRRTMGKVYRDSEGRT